MVNLEWNEVKGYNRHFNYNGNVDNNVKLPKLEELVIICKEDKNFDSYEVGYLVEGDYGLKFVNRLYSIDLVDGLKWAYFNKPATKNNLHFGVAFYDENGENFKDNIPNIIDVGRNKDLLLETVFKLNNKGCSNITTFTFIEPCTYEYTWDYVCTHKVSTEFTAVDLIKMLQEKVEAEGDMPIVIPGKVGEVNPNYIGSQDDNFILTRI